MDKEHMKYRPKICYFSEILIQFTSGTIVSFGSTLFFNNKMLWILFGALGAFVGEKSILLMIKLLGEKYLQTDLLDDINDNDKKSDESTEENKP